jgi:hypothetical protein
VSRHPIAACCIIGFFSGPLLDIDHIPWWLFHVKYPVPVAVYGQNTLAQGRNLHGLALVGGGVMCALAGGSVLLMVLEDQAIKMVNKIKHTILAESPETR